MRPAVVGRTLRLVDSARKSAGTERGDQVVAWRRRSVPKVRYL